MTKPMVAAFLFWGVWVGLVSPSSAAEQKISIAFRYDDYNNRSPKKLEEYLMNIFRANDVTLTIGVIPFLCVDREDFPNQKDIQLKEDRIQLLKEFLADGSIEISMHGYCHKRNGRGGSKFNKTEFVGLPRELQDSMISKGKDYLEETFHISIKTFIPPWNSYDRQTVEVLEGNQFSVLSADETRVVAKTSHLKYLPVTCELNRVKDMVEMADMLPEKNPMIIVMLHRYDFKEFNPRRGLMTLFEFSRFISWLRQHKNVEVVSLEQMARKVDDASADRYRHHKQYAKLSLVIPPWDIWGVKYPHELYLSSRTVRLGFMKFGMFTVFTILIFFFLSYVLTVWVSTGFPSSKKVFLWGGLAGLTGLCFYVFHNNGFYYKGFLSLLIGVSSYLGLLAAVLRQRKGMSQDVCESKR